jgi:hypothetical protein
MECSDNAFYMGVEMTMTTEGILAKVAGYGNCAVGEPFYPDFITR